MFLRIASQRIAGFIAQLAKMEILQRYSKNALRSDIPSFARDLLPRVAVPLSLPGGPLQIMKAEAELRDHLDIWGDRFL